MDEELEHEKAFISGKMKGEQEQIVPARWVDIFLYLIGGFGAYLSFSLVVGLLYRELTLELTVLTSLLNFLCFAGVVYLFGVRRGKLSWAGIGLIPPKQLWQSVFGGALLAFVVNIFRIMVVFALVLIIGVDLESLAMRGEFFMTGLETWYGVILNLIGIGVLVPIAEELFFRGLVYDWLRQKMPIWAAVVISSVLFGLGHFDSWMMIVSTFIMGIALAIAYESTKSIWISIFIHIFTNAGVVVLMVFFTLLEKVALGLYGFL
jgi:membrane protease YdiL (CAAX protease family)